MTGTGTFTPPPPGLVVLWSERLASQKTKPISTKKISTVTETILVAKPSVGVKASTEVSRMTP